MGYAPIADPVVHGAARHLQILADSMGLNHTSLPPMSGTASRHIKESSLVFSSLGITLSPVGALFYIVAYHLFVQPLSGVGNALRTGFMMLRSSPQAHKGVRFRKVPQGTFYAISPDGVGSALDSGTFTGTCRWSGDVRGKGAVWPLESRKSALWTRLPHVLPATQAVCWWRLACVANASPGIASSRHAAHILHDATT